MILPMPNSFRLFAMANRFHAKSRIRFITNRESEPAGSGNGAGPNARARFITGRHDKIDLCVDENHCFRKPAASIDVVADERIGIRRSAHLPWRFTLRDSVHVSRKVRSARAQLPAAL